MFYDFDICGCFDYTATDLFYQMWTLLIFNHNGFMVYILLIQLENI